MCELIFLPPFPRANTISSFALHHQPVSSSRLVFARTLLLIPVLMSRPHSFVRVGCGGGELRVEEMSSRRKRSSSRVGSLTPCTEPRSTGTRIEQTYSLITWVARGGGCMQADLVRRPWSGGSQAELISSRLRLNGSIPTRADFAHLSDLLQSLTQQPSPSTSLHRCPTTTHDYLSSASRPISSSAKEPRTWSDR